MKRTLFGAVALALTSTVALADGIMINDPYARASTMMSKSGAAFMGIMNHTGADQTLVAAQSDVAQRVELHTHKEDANGVMRMMEVEGGIPVPAGETVMLQRGGLHVMFLGLTRTLEQGDKIDLTLTFEPGGDVAVTVPVDLERKPMHGGHGSHGSHDGHSDHKDHSGHKMKTDG